MICRLGPAPTVVHTSCWCGGEAVGAEVGCGLEVGVCAMAAQCGKPLTHKGCRGLTQGLTAGQYFADAHHLALWNRSIHGSAPESEDGISDCA